MARATLKTHNQSPRKVRLVTNLVKGKKVDAALTALTFLPRRAAEPVEKLIKSAVASAKSEGKDANIPQLLHQTNQNPLELAIKPLE
jgi:large subunit ribosomal protein L22